VKLHLHCILLSHGLPGPGAASQTDRIGAATAGQLVALGEGGEKQHSLYSLDAARRCSECLLCIAIESMGPANEGDECG
jgi:hypothetical protein